MLLLLNMFLCDQVYLFEGDSINEVVQLFWGEFLFLINCLVSQNDKSEKSKEDNEKFFHY